MTFDASNRKDIRALEKLATDLERDNLRFLCAMMDTVEGRRWLYHRLADCQVFVDIPTFEPHHDYFSAGRRSMGLPLLADLLTHCPDQYALMLREENVRLAIATERSRRPVPDGSDPGRDDASAADAGADHNPYDLNGTGDE